MVQIIVEEVEMPDVNQRRYVTAGSGQSWLVLDTFHANTKAFHAPTPMAANLACLHLNKKHYLTFGFPTNKVDGSVSVEALEVGKRYRIDAEYANSSIVELVKVYGRHFCRVKSTISENSWDTMCNRLSLEK
ncbi:MAG: hypothetical protein QG594_742 [Bacteroidota bacterium]|nr:hypothetical protein [Bacteroidota bacterium]